MKRKRNYSRFYAIAKAKSIDLDQHKEVLVSQFTGGRTSSLREMTPAEYEEMCECLQTGKQLGEPSAAYRERLRRARSAASQYSQQFFASTFSGTYSATSPTRKRISPAMRNVADFSAGILIYREFE